MKITRSAVLFPSGKGLDLTSVPGTQDPRTLSISKNTIYKNKGGVRKAPGIVGLPYAGDRTGIQGATHFFATLDGSQSDEIVQVRKGRVEVIRGGQAVDLGVAVSPTDAITFERFSNTLGIHFENTAPKKYTPGSNTLTDLDIISGHESNPPKFSRKHKLRYWYAGRGDAPDRLTASAINQLENYRLTSGGFQMRIDEGDGDPVGLTGLSPTFRGDLYAFKYNSIHRIFLGGFGYGVDIVTAEAGSVNHNGIVATQNDVIFPSPYALHSLVATDKHGAVEESTLSYPIFEWYQENINWNNSRFIISTYDKPSNCFMMAHPSVGSGTNNKVLGFNILTKEFWIWEDCDFPVLTKYFDSGQQKTLVGCEGEGLGVLDEKDYRRFEKAYDYRIKTNPIFPLGEPKAEVTFTKAWVIMKPSVDANKKVKFSFHVDEQLVNSEEISVWGNGYGGVIGNENDKIGTAKIGVNKSKVISAQVDLAGTGNAIEFEVEYCPKDTDKDQFLEVYGIIYEWKYNEDKDAPATV